MLPLTRCCCVQRGLGEEQSFPGAVTSGVEPVLLPRDAQDAEPQDWRRLFVPPDFSIRGLDSAIPPASTGAASYESLDEEAKAREKTKLQHMIRDFVMQLLQGVYIDVVLADGSLVPCKCNMDSRVSELVLTVQSTQRQIEFITIQEICAGKELSNLRVTTPLDENCVTLVMSNDQCVSFKFPSLQAREHFATCMKVLRLALD